MSDAFVPGVDAVAFDVVGTLFSLDPVAARLEDAGLAPGALDEWFARFLRDAFALEAVGRYAPFREIAEATLEAMLVQKSGLTNGAAGTTQHLLARAGLESFVERTISIDEIRHWKPGRDIYLHAAQTVGMPPGRLALVAAHAWDIAGANAAGLVTGWVAREETFFHRAMGRPVVSGKTLVDVVEALMAHTSDEPTTR